MYEIDNACVTLEKDRLSAKEIEIVSFYDENHICHGDIDISVLDIYEVQNPYFLADTFVFCKKEDSILYIKVNDLNQIEEIGNDFERRFHFSNYDALLQRKDVKPATALHKIIFSIIGNEYWK